MNATEYARELFAKGKSFDAVVRAIEAQGRSHNSARESARQAKRQPYVRKHAARGTMSGVVVSCSLPAEMVEALRKAAEQRGISSHRLASEALAAVIEDNLFNAVLDDQG